ncbi:MAG: DUF1552 domain-containing protein [Planctomycetota bacterium]|nr:DUF1552 domain-containing protein [Planctomycetota bacterium]
MSFRKMKRRTVLQGAGATTIAFPLLEEMMVSHVLGASSQFEKSPPVRAFNVFFGLGVPAPLQAEGWQGVLEPLKKISDKLLILRNVDQVRCDESGINAHFDGASGAFTAEPPNGEAKSGGASIDQVVRRELYPGGQPVGVVPTLIGGTFFRRSRLSRYVHSYNADGTVAARMQEKPRDLFDRVFGVLAIGGKDESARRLRLRRSVLDSVVEQYRFYIGNRSPLGSASRSRIADHLDRIRELEQRAFSMGERDSKAPRLPPRSQVAHGGAADPGGQGIDIKLDELTGEWRLMADLYSLAIEMDRVRFGSLTFLAAGERLRVTGDYHFDGKKVFQFDDARQLNASGDKGCSHEWWHQFHPKKKNEALRAHAHMKMREVAYFLERLDQIRDPNGRTALENSMVTVSTESGDGRHSNVKRELSGVFHAISEANGRFKSGQILDVDAEGLDVYNTMLTAMGVEKKIGPSDREHQSIDAIRA